MSGERQIKRLGLDAALAVEGSQKLAENVLCAICHDFLEDVVETNCQGRHVFCRPCIHRVLRRRQTCPTCRGVFSKLEVANSMIRNLIEQIKWKCLNHEKGCSFTGTKKDLEKHLEEECEEQESECPFEGCTVMKRRTKMLDHKNTCRFRLVSCTHCTKQLPFNGMTAHLEVCKRFPVDCPNACGKKLPRGEIGKHQASECAEETVCCFVPGCGEKRKRKEMDTHEDESWKKHMRLLVELQQKKEEALEVTVAFPQFRSKIAGMKKGDKIESPSFVFQDCRFSLSLFPRGLSDHQRAAAEDTDMEEAESEEEEVGSLGAVERESEDEEEESEEEEEEESLTGGQIWGRQEESSSDDSSDDDDQSDEEEEEEEDSENESFGAAEAESQRGGDREQEDEESEDEGEGEAADPNTEITLYLNKKDDYKGLLTYSVSVCNLNSERDPISKTFTDDFTNLGVGGGWGLGSFCLLGDLVSAASNTRKGTLEFQLHLSAAASNRRPVVVSGYV
uniref:RING-type domain-containing protein n=1 Tax=Chromera velia CCMP2878 TaxID=1169474 RepID=A0A0G4IC22_9ALVE|eukprot:Cvel_12894.t1-p1 / transcript=Cvel_12894.t1 / gene=Cvel_12894 / organism=Chromera_velia_CCMP2878 / gene_product=TNF receptor-associated factor 5, putative / transcript_product=TNF receptor-associated factor 5, putative / location=Cvel_scaffold861:56713-60193(+) / protein_length=505 / sequence_SO=supercontig / SO=protein_coding / is_pseudo=false